jgi:tRNA modification GTPase
MHLDDTIVALSSPAGVGARAVVRLSGARAWAIAAAVFSPEATFEPGRRRWYAGSIRLPDLASTLPADVYYWPAPRTYTGQEIVEIHTLAAPPLVELLIAALLQAGARAANPGEFTLRAFLAGKLDLPRAEAVLGVIGARNRDELTQALGQLAGGITQPLHGLRDDLLNLLADLEAGLDFAEEDITFVGRDDLLHRLARALAHVTLVHKQLAQRSLSGRPFRVVLTGLPNVGKSSLFNALVGQSAALVSPEPGTTRDYLVRRLLLEGVPVELVDTAGWQEASDAIEQQAQSLGSGQRDQANLVLHCIDCEKGTQLISTPADENQLRPLFVATKCDLGPPPPDLLATSAVTGTGIGELRQLLGERARAHAQPPLAPSISRCRHHVEACLEKLRRAHELVLFEEPPELLALELRGALDELGALVGAVYTEDLLDRVFSRFCIGK